MDDREISPDPLAYRDDMALAAEVLDEHPHEEKALDYDAQFLVGLAHSVGDHNWPMSLIASPKREPKEALWPAMSPISQAWFTRVSRTAGRFNRC